jgi:diaminopimelate epimerase
MIGFYKLSGGGNDFLALVEPESEPTTDAVRAWCARGLSVGADGLFTLARGSGGVRMIHYNADGGRAELCLNGTRCAARLAMHLGWATDSLLVETDSGEIAACAAGDSSVALELAPPVREPLQMTLGLDGEQIAGWRLRVGGPHFVLAWEKGLGEAPLEQLGPPLRAHIDLGEAGANVHFVDYADRSRFGIRSWERGVEGETLACGSGVLAAAAVGIVTGRLELPATALTRGGFELRVAGTVEERRIVDWSLTGDARLIAEGTLHPDAAKTPEPPAW